MRLLLSTMRTKHTIRHFHLREPAQHLYFPFPISFLGLKRSQNLHPEVLDQCPTAMTAVICLTKAYCILRDVCRMSRKGHMSTSTTLILCMARHTIQHCHKLGQNQILIIMLHLPSGMYHPKESGNHSLFILQHMDRHTCIEINHSSNIKKPLRDTNSLLLGLTDFARINLCNHATPQFLPHQILVQPL